MLIRLLPAPHQPTILFKLTFENLSGNLQLPLAWTHQMAALDIDDIEIPKLIHAFDKAVGLQCILEEVRFDLVTRVVKCSFVDGVSEEWPMEEELECGCPNIEYKGSLGCGLCRRGPTLMERLESVLDDVNESAKETERERKEEEDQRRILSRNLHQVLDTKGDDPIHAAEHPLSLNSPPGSFKRAHKKQRSMLMNLVASLLPATSSDSTRHPRSLKRSNSLPGSRSSSPPEQQTTPNDPPSSAWSTWTTLTRSASNPISHRASWGRRNKRGHKSKSNSVSDPNTRDSSVTDKSSEESPTPCSPLSPVSTSAPSSAFRPSKASKHSSLPAFSLAESYETAPIVISPPPPPRLSSKALRRRARSTLVDSFRACVLPELRKRVRGQPATHYFVWERAITYATTYYTWSMNNMIRRVENNLTTVVDEATDYLTNAGVQFLSHPASQGVNAGVPQSEEDSVASLYVTAAESSVTETTSVEDGFFDSDSTDEHVPRPSSPVPTDFYGTCVEPQSSSSSSALQTSDVVAAHTPRTSLPSFPTVDTSTLSLILNHVIAHLDTTYTTLLALHSHLSAVLAAAKQREKETIMEAQARDKLLEIRGRKKAWLGKGWGLARSQGELAEAVIDSSTWRISSHGAFELAMPFRPSGLGLHTWTCEEWEYEPWYCFPGYCPDPKGHSHESFDSFLGYRDDTFDGCYVEEEEEEEEGDDDGSSLSSSSLSLPATYQYQSSGVAYEEHPPPEYSSCARIRRSLEEDSFLCDETFPEIAPDMHARRTSVGSDSTIENEATNFCPQMELVSPLTECFTNPFDEEDKILTERRRSEFSIIGGVARRHHRASLPESYKDSDSDSVISSWTRSSISSSSSSRTQYRRRSSVNSTVFFPVSEEFDEEATDRMLFTVSVDVRDNPVFSPEMTRSRKSSMPNDYFGTDYSRRASDTFPTSPISPVSPSGVM